MYMPVCTLCVWKLDVQAVVNYLTGCWDLNSGLLGEQ